MKSPVNFDDPLSDEYIPDVNGLGMTPLQEFFAADDSLLARREAVESHEPVRIPCEWFCPPVRTDGRQ